MERRSALENARRGRGTRIMQRPLQKLLEHKQYSFSSTFEDAVMDDVSAGLTNFLHTMRFH